MAENENERLILFSDGVIAITITLLVLEIRLPVPAEKLTDAELWSALVEIWPRFLAYVLSFVVIGAIWMGHRRKFEWITRSSPILLWLNIFFLMAIGIMPFVTNVLAENGGKVATILYASTVILISLFSAAMSFHAAQAGLAETPSSRPNVWQLSSSLQSTGLVFLLSIPIALWDADYAKFFWLMLIPASFLTRRFR